MPLSSGTRVTAGERLGTTGSVYAIDLGVANYGLTLAGLLNPNHYNDDTLHTDAPLKYFEEPLRSQLYARVQRNGSDLDGKIDFDVAGRLSGNWYEDATSFPIAFVYDTYDPSQVRISIATFVSGLFFSGVFAIAPGDPLPRDVSVASGVVRYSLFTSRTGPPIAGPLAGNMLVQMLDGGHLHLEIFPTPAPATGFTGGAKRFSR